MPFGMRMNTGAGTETEDGMFGMGSMVGGAVGLGTGILSDVERRKQRKKEEAASRPQRRRLTSILDTLNRYKQQQLAARTSAAAAGFDFANQLRF